MAKLRYIKGSFCISPRLMRFCLKTMLKILMPITIIKTSKMCKGIAAELKSLLKTEWKKVELGYQAEGCYF